MNRDLLLWIGILTGPIIWFINMETGFVLAPWLCAWQSRFVPNLVSVIALLLVAGSGLIGWHLRTELRPNSVEPDAVDARPVAMATGAMVLSAMFFLVIFVQMLPQFFLDGCQ